MRHGAEDDFRHDQHLGDDSLGRVEGNNMVNVRLINDKVVDRSVQMLMEKTALTDYEEAKRLILEFGNVKKAMDYLRSKA